MRKPIGAELVVDERPLQLEHGARLPRIEIAFESWGTLAAGRDNAVLVCPAFSAHSHASSHAADTSPGWWEGMIGSGRALDSDRYFVVCPSLLGGSYGTTGPLSLDPATGSPYGVTFPVVTVGDIVALHVRLLEHLGLERYHLAVGGSLGAMEALELAVAHPGSVERVIAFSGTDRTRPYTAAIRHLGRQAIVLDPDFRDGTYDGPGPQRGLKLARELGTLFYRSREEFNSRFAWDPLRPPRRQGITFEVESYLDHQGNKALGRFDANSYLTLSLAMDLHDLWRHARSPAEALEPVTSEFVITGVAEDRLIPLDEQKRLHRTLVGAGKKSLWRPLSSPIGHDAFLVERTLMTELLRELLG